jgi:hypothetical protein
MTKISQKEYVESIVSMVRQTCTSIVYEHIGDELGLIKPNFDNQRVINMIINESMCNLNKNIEQFIAENGIPRKQRTKKDGNEKKRKPNAYILYCHQHREEVKENMPAGSRAGEITKKLSEMWNSLSEEEQATYEYNEEEIEEENDDNYE